MLSPSAVRGLPANPPLTVSTPLGVTPLRYGPRLTTGHPDESRPRRMTDRKERRDHSLWNRQTLRSVASGEETKPSSGKP
jgi:hypothetical protein